MEGREIMLVIDLSASMAQRDLALGRPMDRLEVVKQVADDFIARRAGDRVGLILFSTRAYVQAPLTLDRNVVRALLAEATIGMTGRNTSIGDAIGLAVKTLRDGPGKERAKDRVVVLLTDGANTSGVLDPPGRGHRCQGKSAHPRHWCGFRRRRIRAGRRDQSLLRSR